MFIKEIKNKKEKIKVADEILKSLPSWFAIPESTEKYIKQSSKLPFFVAIDGSDVVAFISLKENSQHTLEIYIMAVLPDYHKQGIGKKLIDKVLKWSKKKGYEFLQVKTLDESHPDPYYVGTRRFYKSVGFKKFESLPELWGEENPCLIMIQHIE